MLSGSYRNFEKRNAYWTGFLFSVTKLLDFMTGHIFLKLLRTVNSKAFTYRSLLDAADVDARGKII